MGLKPGLANKLSYYGLVTALNLVVMSFGWLASPLPVPGSNAQTAAAKVKTLPNSQQKDQIIQEQKAMSGKPARIVVPSLGIDLPIIEGYFNPKDETWTLKDDKAHFAAPTMPVNDKGGNTLIYGHNTPQIFKPMHKINKRAKMKIYTKNGYKFTYVYQLSRDVKPNNVGLFKFSGPPMVIVQTCGGNWDELRSMFLFSLESVEKI